MTGDRILGDRGREFLQDSLLVRELEAEREEILRHKWIESEKAGHDIGYARAQINWRIRHRSKWWRARHPVRN